MTLDFPEILAPAGDKNSFLAAIAAGADAVYCGLKIFSARMEAENFGIEDLSRLTRLAHARNVRVYVAFNSIIKQGEQEKVFRILSKLSRYTRVDALIIQDLALISLARNAGFEGDFHLSTLGNLSFPAGFAAARDHGFSKVVLPREFTIDEIKQAADRAPDRLALEVFIHGALCYSVSGRCYWSSWFGGKSALRGRCVQPCRRIYEQKQQKKRHFSCTDFSADVLVKVLKEIPRVTTWKIEGRKKSPHYVFYTVKAYRLLRDDPKRKKEALGYLDYALGRQFTHYNLLSQRRINPLDHTSQTGSGLFLGRVKNVAAPYVITREALFPGDLLRIGNEEDKFHDIQKVTRAVPKKGKFYLAREARHKVIKGAPVHLIDRRGRELEDQITRLGHALTGYEAPGIRPAGGPPAGLSGSRSPASVLPAGRGGKRASGPRAFDMRVFRGKSAPGRQNGDTGAWISAGRYGIRPAGRTWFWLDPLLFPEEEALCRQFIGKALAKGSRNFVLNAVWQIALFDRPEKLNLWAGPFCNITNATAVEALKQMGYSGAIVSPELDRETFLALPEAACLPLGVVIRGNWPLAVSRIISPDLKPGTLFTSPKGEGAWITRANDNFLTFPNWCLDLSEHRALLRSAGYTCFVTLEETIPRGVKLKPRPGLWNWNLKLV